MLMVGLTGGIGSGKSVVATRLSRLGAVLIDADRIAREVVAPGTEGLAEIVATFGDRVLAADGSLDRPALGALVFDDEPARRQLERITHPRVRARTAQLAAGAPADAIVVNDVPLLVEAGLAPTYHLVVVVTADRATRVDRLVRDRGMSVEQAEQRIRAQTGDPQRRAAADVVLGNDGDLADLHGRVETLWRDRLLPYEHNLRDGVAVRGGTVKLTEADPDWPVQYARLAARIRHAVRPADLRIDHVGSTSVPGLAAKNVIDIQLTVESIDQADKLAGPLGDAGFPRCAGDWWDQPRYPTGDARWEKRLHGSADPARPVNLHLRVGGTPGWRYALLMRDHLRADERQRAGYLALKRGLAAGGPDTASYAAAKEPWFDGEHVEAERWAATTDWRP
ncbi:dephospho-CoA kinase [Micromonospora sp. NBC_01699]|uniref:dephospho-CoA kinase n=1 Tax=Micromonospora sp. NBC_01699 TaxID=2975984 RepID=UPI002E2CDA14|nr:dephospho-CoA kinase [Micromonospora sp. NBC_01699]